MFLMFARCREIHPPFAASSEALTWSLARANRGLFVMLLKMLVEDRYAGMPLAPIEA